MKILSEEKSTGKPPAMDGVPVVFYVAFLPESINPLLVVQLKWQLTSLEQLSITVM